MRAVYPIRIADVSLDGTNYVRSTVVQIWEDMAVFFGGSLLIGLSILVVAMLVWSVGCNVLWATSLFTLAPAWTAFCYMVGCATINRKAGLGDFMAAFVRYYWQSCLLALPVVVLLVTVLVSFPLLTGAPTVLLAMGVVFQIAALGIAIAVYIFAAPILATAQVNAQQAWTYGLVLGLRHPIVALGLISMAVLLVLVADSLGLGVWLIIPLIFIPFEMNATLMLARKTIELERAQSR